MENASERLWEDFAASPFVNELRLFVAERVVPKAHEIDELDIYPTDIVREISRKGWSTVCLPICYGGAAANYRAAVTVCEEVAYGSAAVAISLITIFQAQTIINLFGSETLKKRYLPAFREGLIASYALTEAAHGSDIRTLETKAVRDGNVWVLNGEKSFITSGSATEFLVILAETPAGVSAFAVPRDVPGVSSYIGRNSATLGLRNGPHVNIKLENVRLPLDHLIGTDGKGVRQAVTTLDYSRILAAGVSVGVARAAFDASLTYTNQRKAFDQTILQFQGIQWYFAELLAQIDAARLLTYRAADALAAGIDVARYSSEAKLFASSVATEVASKSIQVCGAYGTMVNAPFGRFFRDAKTYEIGGGSSEVLKNTIAKSLLKRLG
jgi:alkylation response protein AidB-like acyl-CoA dehydrogenase